MATSRWSWIKDICLLTLTITLMYGALLGQRPLSAPDEGRYSEIPREMLLSHDFITPHLNGIKYFEKPPFFYWIQTLSIKAFGLNEASLRLVTELMGILGCLATYLATRKLYNRRTAILSALILGSGLLYAGLAHFITLDMTVSTFLTISLLSFLVGNRYPPGGERRHYLWLMYLFAALATLTKGLIGIIFPGMIIFTWLLLTHRWDELKSYALFSGTILFLMIVLPWHILVQIRNPEFFHFYFIEQHFLRYLTRYAGRTQPVWFFPGLLILGFFPWTGFLFSALKNKMRLFKNRKDHGVEIFLLLWASLIFLFYWLSKSQLSPYILPVFPPLAILTAKYIDENWQEKSLRFGFSFALLFSFILMIGDQIFIHLHEGLSWSKNDLICLSPLLFLVSFYLYHRRYMVLAMGCLIINTWLTLWIITLSYEHFDPSSVKQFSMELNTVLKADDQVYNFNHYYQDMPVYLKRPVKIVNWKGELTYGSEHQRQQTVLVDENTLCKEWPTPTRKFLVAKKADLDYLSTILRLNYFVIDQNRRYALICNQEIKP